MTVIVTETAAREIHNIILQQELDPEKVRLRVGVKGGGCSGFSYLLDLTETQKDSDEMWEFSYTLPVKKSATAAASKEANASGGGVAVAEAGQGESFTVRVICDPKSYI